MEIQTSVLKDSLEIQAQSVATLYASSGQVSNMQSGNDDAARSAGLAAEGKGQKISAIA